MQLTVDFEDADQIAAIAHLSQILALARNNDDLGMKTLYPPDVMRSLNVLMDAVSEVMDHIDSPFNLSDEYGKYASIVAQKMQHIGAGILDMGQEFSERQASNK